MEIDSQHCHCQNGQTLAIYSLLSIWQPCLLWLAQWHSQWPAVVLYHRNMFSFDFVVMSITASWKVCLCALFHGSSVATLLNVTEKY